MAVFNRLLYSQIKTIMLSWVLVTAIMLIARMFIQTQHLFSEICFNLMFFGSIFSVMSSKAHFAQGRYGVILKNSTKNLKSYWYLIVLQNVIILSLTFFIIVILSKSINLNIPEEYLQDHIDGLLVSVNVLRLSTLSWLSISILMLLVLILADCSNPIDRMSRGITDTKTQLVKVVRWILIYVCVVIIASIGFVSPLLAISLVTLFIYLLGIFLNDECIKTLPRNVRLKTASYGSFVLIFIFLVIGLVEYKVDHNSYFLYMRPKSWSYSDIEKVKNIEEWIMWQNKLKSQDVLTVEQLMETYDKVSQYCPPHSRDNPLTIECEGLNGYRDYQFTSKTLRSEEDVLKLLSSSNEYTQIMGLMYARKLQKPLSKSVILAVEFIAEKESTIQGLARNTLSMSFPIDYRDGMLFVTKKSVVPKE